MGAPPDAAADRIEQDDEIPTVSRWALSFTGGKRWAAVGALLVGGGLVIFFVAEPFLASMLGLATSLGMSQFVFIQWVAPFLSEFPEKTSAFAWARRVTPRPGRAGEHGVLEHQPVGHPLRLLAVIYCWSHGSTAPLPFDDFQRQEILLTILQAFLGWLFLASMTFEAYEAVGLFILWLVQFVVPSLRSR